MRYIVLLVFSGVIFSCSDNADKSVSDAPTLTTTEDTIVIEESIRQEELLSDSVVLADTVTDRTEEFEEVDWAAYEEAMTRDYSFVILISTKSYDTALKRAKEASKKLGYPLNLRGLHENGEIGLSFSQEVCEEEICGGGLSYPIYIPRSDRGDSKYISVEYSDSFGGFTKGYYIVVAASGEKGDPVIQEALEESQLYYEDAYAKTCGVWMGCGC